MHDILIKGGIVFDGSGSAGVSADVAIKNGRIAAIGSPINDPAVTIIDASGLAVAPGFIDIKTHSDFTLPINPKAGTKELAHILARRAAEADGADELRGLGGFHHRKSWEGAIALW